MHYIEKKDGYVYFVQEVSNDGRFVTYFNMGKDPDDPRWKTSTKKEESK